VTGLVVTRWWRPGWGPRSFDPVRLGHRETDTWAAYYRHEWWTFLRAALGMARTGFGTDPARTGVGAFHVLRANQPWAPYPDNDPHGARAPMRRFYAMIARDQSLALDRLLVAERRALVASHTALRRAVGEE
jgi:hypothetical protein